MHHDVVIEGCAFRLRPIRDEDAGFVVELRSDSQLGRYLHATSGDVSDQLAWFAEYYDREGDYYFVVERVDTGIAEGVISIYDLDASGTSAEWGRWILRRDSLAAVESALLIYRCAFEVLKLDRVYCRTVADNKPVVSFHDSCDIPVRRVLQGHFHFGEDIVDAVEHEVDAVTWSVLRPRLEKLAMLTQRRLHRG